MKIVKKEKKRHDTFMVRGIGASRASYGYLIPRGYWTVEVTPSTKKKKKRNLALKSREEEKNTGHMIVTRSKRQ